MSNQYFNFYYDPAREGYDNSHWRTLFGDVPQVGSNRLMIFSQSSIIHLADILRGDAFFSLNIPAPAVGDDIKFGFLQYSKNAYAYFKITNDVLSAETSNGTTSTSTTITWQSAWTNTNTEFRIKWEAGIATFYVGGIQQATNSDASVSGDPLSLYISNNSTNTILLNYIDVKTIQSYILHEGLEDSSFNPVVFESDSIEITESVTILVPTLFTPAAGGNLFDGITLTESVTMNVEPSSLNPSISDSINITESQTVLVLSDVNVNDNIEITESVTVTEPVYTIDVNDSMSITESLTVDMF